ncbi:MAG TPA: hypothetical protein VF782_00950 [Allosphingosinicella sp.]|jgi:hypothetical protein
MKPGLTLLALAGLAPSSPPQSDAPEAEVGHCTRAAVGSAAIAMRNARAELMAVPLEDDDTSVPPSTSRRIEAAKDRLLDFVRTMVACAPTSVEPAVLAAAMEQRGGAPDAPPHDPGSPAPDRHGKVVAYEVSRVDSNPDMLAVIVTLGIKCGSDSMLILYRRTRPGWREVMVRRSEPYSEVRGGWQDLRFAVSPADAAGNWFVATVSTTPWCTSAWQGLPYELARRGPSPDRPRVLFKGKSIIYLGHESDLILKAERDAFEIRHDGSSLDPDILIRRHVRRYAVAGGSVRRVQPVAENVRDFVDEWIDSPWAEAKAWSGSDPGLAPAHRGLKAARDMTLGGFASILACRGGATQIELAGQEGPGWFLLVRGGVAGPWTMERVTRRAAASCAGPNRLNPPGAT